MSVKKLTSILPNKPQVERESPSRTGVREAFWIVQEGGGFVIYSSLKGAISEPEVWAITSSVLLQKIRKSLGM